MNKEQEKQITPEARTAALFSYAPGALAKQLIKGGGIVVAIPETDTKVRIFEAEPYEKRKVGKRYSAMNYMTPGDLWNPPMRQILQSLIVAKDRDGVGACIRLKKVEYFDPKTQVFVPVLTTSRGEFGAREGDIAKYLGLRKRDQGKLKFLDNSDTLYLIREESAHRPVAPEQADNQLRDLLGGGQK